MKGDPDWSSGIYKEGFGILSHVLVNFNGKNGELFRDSKGSLTSQFRPQYD